ncbi:DUF3040 domain-containing protein [Sporichthya sp.]|uniref:DUF3040 domain-containing protein n=1 Tax=Sporichthya sp. TaxID=65475 RepID=UPI0017D28D56|nr:DUF3040 domain-containing protein [Sporichthya sp.]MBA3744549.1 DUF3040 domain-containing protein [Sporichthya sp.]
MSLSDRDRRLLAEMARRLEEQDPELVSALRGPAEPATPRELWPRRVLARWQERFRESERAPIRTAVAAGAFFVAGLMLVGDFSGESAPTPGARSEMPVFAEQQLDR